VTKKKDQSPFGFWLRAPETLYRLCPVELFTKCFMTIVLQLLGPRPLTKMPSTSVGVCRY
jgi:hypothetical protein